MSYEAIVARAMGLDFVNLGFGGAGKAEEAVVELVAELAACCFVFDLGKSYGTQSARAYVRMLETVRAAHPTTPRCRSSRRRGAPAGPRARARRFRRLHHLRHRRSRSPPRRLWPWDPLEKAVDTIRFQRARRRHPRRLRRRSLGRMQTRR